MSDADLTAWLRATIEAEKAGAQAAGGHGWVPSDEGYEVWADDGIPVADGFALSNRQLRATVTHIVLHDPQNTIDRCDTDLQLLDTHAAVADPYSPTGSVCKTCNDGGLPVEPTCSPCATVRLLGYGRRRQPGYNTAWAPEGIPA